MYFFLKEIEPKLWENFVPLLWKQKIETKEFMDDSILDQNVLRVVRIHDKAIIPKKATNGSAARDLYAIEDQVVDSYTSAKIPLGIRMAIPKGMYGRIAGRSSLALKSGVIIGGGS